MRRINKKNLSILIIILLIIIGSIILLVNLLSNDKKKEPNHQEQLEVLFETMIKEYYEEFYYNQIGSTQDKKEEFLKKYKTSGIKINLDSLSRYNSSVNEERIKAFVNKETNEKCNLENSIGIIYPMEPYKKDSHTISVKLDCGFKEENK